MASPELNVELELDELSPQELHQRIVSDLRYGDTQETPFGTFNFNFIDAIDSLITLQRQRRQAETDAVATQQQREQAGLEVDLNAIWLETETWAFYYRNGYGNIQNAVDSRRNYGEQHGPEILSILCSLDDRTLTEFIRAQSESRPDSPD